MILAFPTEVSQVAEVWLIFISMKKTAFYFSFLCLLFSFHVLPAQHAEKTDSIITTILNESKSTGADDQGLMLIKNEKYDEANKFFTGAINKDESNRESQ